MRRLAAAVTLAILVVGAGCGGAAGGAGPAWPRSAGTDLPDDPSEDGGVSLEPPADHPTALEESDDEDDAPAVVVSASPDTPAKPAATTDPVGAPAPAKVDPPPADAPPPMVEEIVIEVGD